jgi:hypothetical protein
VVGATLALAYYAYVTIKEGRKNRRKDTIERKLENLYSPLYEILSGAKFTLWETTSERDYVKSFLKDVGPNDYVLKDQELRKIHDIIERSSHYMDLDDRGELTKALQKFKLHKLTTLGIWYQFFGDGIDPCLDRIARKRERLMKELEKLTAV